MDTTEKLKILSQDSQYDLACACGTNDKDRRKRGLEGKWLYPVTLPYGGQSIMLKTLLSNTCTNDCKYCPLRQNSNVQRCMMGPEEAARTFMDYLSTRGVIGLFLSSGIINTPDYTMDRINAVARILRTRYNYRGYIHLKIIPGASDAAVEDSMSLANAVSLNIETPGREHFKLLGKSKDYDRDIIRPLKFISETIDGNSRYSKVKATTQFIVGASDETDSEIVKYSYGVYNRLKFNRIYFSIYQPGLGERDIPGEKNYSLSPAALFTREHRLYQVDFLIRQYGFKENDILFEKNGNLSIDKDPKEIWAERHPELYPVKINQADKETLLKVPGLGPVMVRRILDARRFKSISSWDMLGIKGKVREKIARYAIFS